MTQEVIVFPDAEAVVITHLKTQIAGLQISTMVPKTRPKRFVKVTRVGGTKIRLNADSPMLTFECWEETTKKAHDLCQLVRAHLHAMAGHEVAGEWVYRVQEVGGPAYFPDPTSDTPRYQITVMVDLKGVAL